MTAVPRRLKRIEVHCPEYETTATIRINDAHSSGTDHLEVDYRSPDHGHFTIAIPDDWTDRDLLELIFLPPRDPGKRNWPAWEIPVYELCIVRCLGTGKARRNRTSELGVLAPRSDVRFRGAKRTSYGRVSMSAHAGLLKLCFTLQLRFVLDAIITGKPTDY